MNLLKLNTIYPEIYYLQKHLSKHVHSSFLVSTFRLKPEFYSTHIGYQFHEWLLGLKVLARPTHYLEQWTKCKKIKSLFGLSTHSAGLWMEEILVQYLSYRWYFILNCSSDRKWNKKWSISIDTSEGWPFCQFNITSISLLQRRVYEHPISIKEVTFSITYCIRMKEYPMLNFIYVWIW